MEVRIMFLICKKDRNTEPVVDVGGPVSVAAAAPVRVAAAVPKVFVVLILMGNNECQFCNIE